MGGVRIRAPLPAGWAALLAPKIGRSLGNRHTRPRPAQDLRRLRAHVRRVHRPFGVSSGHIRLVEQRVPLQRSRQPRRHGCGVVGGFKGRQLVR
jgi:hypothetical protein